MPRIRVRVKTAWLLFEAIFNPIRPRVFDALGSIGGGG